MSQLIREMIDTMNSLNGNSNGQFIPVKLDKEIAQYISDWKKIIINGTEYDFIRPTGSDSNKFIIQLDGVGEIGRASLNDYDMNFDGHYLDNIRIDEKYRRIGLATKLYEYIEGLTGVKLKPSPLKQSPDIKKYWNKKNGLMNEGTIDDFKYDAVRNQVQKLMNNGGLTPDDITPDRYFIVCFGLFNDYVTSISTLSKEEAVKHINHFKNNNNIWKIYAEKPSVAAKVFLRKEYGWVGK